MKFSLAKMRINKSGYNDRGVYYGSDALAVYQCQDSNGDWVADVRARNREDAKRLVWLSHPDASFHR